MRILHTMLRVGDLDKSITFYTDVLGMTELRRSEYPDGEFTLVHQPAHNVGISWFVSVYG